MKARVGRTGLIAAIALAVLFSGLCARASTINRAKSAALTQYLREHQLPLVGAQVSAKKDGEQRVVLFGFVASEQSKADAERRAISYLNIPGITLIDRIVVKPEIRDLSNQAGAEGAAAASSGAAKMTWDELMEHIQGSPIRLAPDSEADTPPPSPYGP